MVVIQYTQENYWRKILAQVTLNPLLASIHLFTPSIHKYVVDSLWDDVTLAFTLRDFHGAEYTSASYLGTHFSKRTVNCCKRVDILLHKLRIQSQLYTLKERRKIFPRIYQKENLLHRILWETLPVVILYSSTY